MDKRNEQLRTALKSAKPYLNGSWTDSSIHNFESRKPYEQSPDAEQLDWRDYDSKSLAQERGDRSLLIPKWPWQRGSSSNSDREESPDVVGAFPSQQLQARRKPSHGSQAHCKAKPSSAPRTIKTSSAATKPKG